MKPLRVLPVALPCPAIVIREYPCFYSNTVQNRSSGKMQSEIEETKEFILEHSVE